MNYKILEIKPEEGNVIVEINGQEQTIHAPLSSQEDLKIYLNNYVVAYEVGLQTEQEAKEKSFNNEVMNLVGKSQEVKAHIQTEEEIQKEKEEAEVARLKEEQEAEEARLVEEVKLVEEKRLADQQAQKEQEEKEAAERIIQYEKERNERRKREEARAEANRLLLETLKKKNGE